MQGKILFVFFIILLDFSFSFPLKSRRDDGKISGIVLGKSGMSVRAPADTCYVTQCAYTGQACNGASTECVSDNTYCENTCIPLEPVGGLCNDDYQCENFCNVSVCAPITYGPGFPCSQSADCASFVCSPNSHTCVGKSLGESCFSSSDCNPPYLCGANNASNIHICLVPLTQGATCDLGDDLCDTDVICTPVNATLAICQPFGSVNKGGLCLDASQCQDTLGCFDGVCGVVNPPSLKPCSKDSDCQSQESCSCSYITGSSVCANTNLYYPAGTSASAIELANCVRVNCSGVEDDDCEQNKCKTEYCANNQLYNAFVKSYLGQTNPSCSLPTTSPSFCGDNATNETVKNLIINPFIFIIALVVVLVSL